MENNPHSNSWTVVSIEPGEATSTKKAHRIYTLECPHKHRLPVPIDLPFSIEILEGGVLACEGCDPKVLDPEKAYKVPRYVLEES